MSTARPSSAPCSDGTEMDLKLEISTTTTLRSAREISSTFSAVLAPVIDAESGAAIELAVAEICTNLAKHGSGGHGETPLTATLKFDGDTVCIVLRDRGLFWDPREFTRPEVDPSRPETLPTCGMGLSIVNDVMDAIDYERRGEENVMTLTKHVARSVAAPDGA